MELGKQTKIAGIIYIVFGLLCVILRSDIITLAAVWLGVALVVVGIVSIIRGIVPPGVIAIILGVIIGLLGKFMVFVLLYFFAIVAIAFGIIALYNFFKNRAANDKFLSPEGLRPVLLILCGVLFFISARSVVNLVFVIIGVLLIVAGVMAIADRNR